MTTIPPHVGIDVAKDRLDVCLEGGSPFRVPNTPAGLGELASRLAPGSVVHLESSGGYERAARRALAGAGCEVRVHDPLRAKRLSQALSGRAKTDALDARRLAELGRQLPAQPERSPEDEALRELSRAAQTLKETAAEYRRRAAAPGLHEAARDAFLEAARALRERADALERTFQESARGTDTGRRAELARSVPGVGPVLARVAACELPLGLADPARLASFAGLAPIDDSSGKRAAPKRIAPGCARLKKALYLAALSLLRSQAWAKELYARLRGKGRAHRQAIVAVMRRLLVRIVAVLKRGSPWVDEPTNA